MQVKARAWPRNPFLLDAEHENSLSKNKARRPEVQTFGQPACVLTSRYQQALTWQPLATPDGGWLP